MKPLVMNRRSALGALLALPALVRAADKVMPDDRDRQVLEVFLLSVLADPQFGLAAWKKPGAILVLHERTPEKTGMLGKGQMASDTHGHAFDPALGEAIRKRNTVPGTEYESCEARFKGLKFDPRILVANIAVAPAKGTEYDFFDAFKAAYPKAQGWVEAWLPAYSQDGRQALVRGSFGPWPHGATATALMVRVGDSWKVEWHDLAFYA